MGEIVWTTDGQQLWVGDGLTQGGSPVVGANVAGFGLAYDPTTRRLEVAGLSADNIANGVNNKFFATELAQDAAASLFVTGTHTNISFVYDDNLGKINATVTLDGTGISDIIADTSPQLGGDLDLNSSDITGTGNIDITGSVSAGSFIVTSGEDIGISITETRIFSSTGIIQIGESALTTVVIESDEISSPILITEGLTSGLQISGHTARARRAANAAVAPGDFIYALTAEGWNGTSFVRSSIIAPMADPFGTLGPTAVPGMIALATFPVDDTAQAKITTLNRNGFLAVNRGLAYDAVAAVDINGLLRLEPQTAAPVAPAVGMIAVANRTSWDPVSVGSGSAYPVFYNGTSWVKMTA
jgi:hypothetical protein